MTALLGRTTETPEASTGGGKPQPVGPSMVGTCQSQGHEWGRWTDVGSNLEERLVERVCLACGSDELASVTCLNWLEEAP